MKKITLLILIILIYSCGNNKEKKMLYEFKQKEFDIFNIDLKDVDFKIKEIKKVADIIAEDSMKHVKKELVGKLYDNPDETLIDTLSFKFLKKTINGLIAHQDTLQKRYQQALLSAIRRDDYSYQMEYESKRDAAMNKMYDYKDAKSQIEEYETRYNNYAKQPKAILSKKYKAIYTIKNPMLGNIKQTHEIYLYTNKEQTEFIDEENVKEK